MKNALANGDIATATSQFSLHTRDAFGLQFESLKDYLPQIASEMGAIRLLEIKEDRAIYDLRKIKDGTEYSFQVEVIKDEDGIWRIWTL